MKKILMVLALILFSVTIINAQAKKIAYELKVAIDCDGFEGALMGGGSIMEGENITFPSYKIPDEYSFLQGYQAVLNVFSEAMVVVPEGTLNENVKFAIMLNPITCEYSEITLDELFGMTVKVIGENSGEHDPLAYYMFNEGKKVTLKLKAEKLLAYLAAQDLTLEDLVVYFISDELVADLTGIKFEYTFGGEWFNIYLDHFSKIAIGVDNSVTDVAVEKPLPTDYKLAQNYPNPFNPSTTISYSLPKDGFTKLTVYNSIGVEIKTLVSENRMAGNYTVNFNASNLPSGIYFYDLSSGNFRSTKKMILMK